MIRQIRPPQVFFTKSLHKTGMKYLIQALRKKDENIIITKDRVKDMTKAERKNIIKKYPIDIVNYLEALFGSIISGLKKNMSLGQCHNKDYFYRVDFPQRRCAYIHCLL